LVITVAVSVVAVPAAPLPDDTVKVVVVNVPPLADAGGACPSGAATTASHSNIFLPRPLTFACVRATAWKKAKICEEYD
jgi:hypothetical protein